MHQGDPNNPTRVTSSHSHGHGHGGGGHAHGGHAAGAKSSIVSSAAPTKCSGNMRLTRWQSSLQIDAQTEEVEKSPMWWAMKLARGLKIVMSEPRSRMNLSWLVSIDSRSSSSLMRRLAGFGTREGSDSAAVCRCPQLPVAGPFYQCPPPKNNRRMNLWVHV